MFAFRARAPPGFSFLSFPCSLTFPCLCLSPPFPPCRYTSHRPHGCSEERYGFRILPTGLFRRCGGCGRARLPPTLTLVRFSTSANRNTLDGSLERMTGAERLAEALLTEGVGCVYGIPGAQENELWDTLKEKDVPYLLVTHEYKRRVHGRRLREKHRKARRIVLCPDRALPTPSPD